MSSVNKVILVGNLGADPELRSMNNGQKVAGLSVATSQQWNDKNTNERREQTQWHRVSIYDPNSVLYAENYLRKGNKVYLEGKLQTRKWQDQTGQDRYTTEIVVNSIGGRLVGLSAHSSEEKPKLPPSSPFPPDGDDPIIPF